MIIDQQTWDAIAQFKPKFRSHVTFYQHVYRKRTWHIVADTLSSTHFRCTDSVFHFIQCLDGEHSIAQAYQYCIHLVGENAPDQAEILQLIATLQAKDLLQGDIPISAQDLYQRHKTHTRQQKIHVWLHPLSFKLSIWDPDKWLDKITPLFIGLFTRWVLMVCALLIILGGAVAFAHWQALTEHFSIRFMGPQNLILIWLLYPLVKFFHEMGHAVLTKHWGGEVHDMGILFIVFMPAPYVDASSSHQFSDKRQRMMVAAAGIFIELLIAAIGILCWIMMDDGLVRDIAFNIAVVGGLSTLFVNGNPLLRFDGYYVLSDAIEIPNLGSRSSKYLSYLSQRILLGEDKHGSVIRSPLTAMGERSWFIFYGITSGIYRLIISFTIAFFVASHYFIVGVLLALWTLVQRVLWPTILAINTLYLTAKTLGRLKRLTIASGISSLLLGILLFSPLHWSSHIEGVITLPEAASIRAGNSGFIKAILKQNGERISVGDVLFELENPELVTKQLLIKAQITELKVRQSDAFITGKLDSQIIKLDIEQAQNTLADVQAQIAQLSVKSDLDGIMSVSNALDMPGRFYRKGYILAHVIDLSAVTVKAIIPQNKFEQLNLDGIRWEIKVNHQPADTVKGTLVRGVPRATFKLPSDKLGSANGGAIMVDARDTEGRTALEAVYQVELLLDNYKAHYLAGKVEVKAQHQPENIATYIYRTGTLFLAKNFNY